MIQTIRSLVQPASLFDPVGLPLGKGLSGVLILFAVIFMLGFILRGVSIFVRRLNPYMKLYLKRMGLALMTFGFLEISYFTIRQARVAYITANIVFVVITTWCLLWLVYVGVFGYFVRYKRESALYKIEQQRRAYLPKKKKK